MNPVPPAHKTVRIEVTIDCLAREKDHTTIAAMARDMVSRLYADIGSKPEIAMVHYVMDTRVVHGTRAD